MPGMGNAIDDTIRGMRLLYRIYKIRLSTAIFISLPLLLLMFWFVAAALHDFHNFKKTVCPEAELTRKTLQFFINAHFLKSVVLLTSSEVPSSSNIPEFRITIPRKSYQQLVSNLPWSSRKDSVKGTLSFEHFPIGSAEPGTERKVKLRFRGDNSFHWFYEKKSWRVITKKNERIAGVRKFNLINPPFHYSPIIDGISYRMADELGLISPDYFPVRVHVNGKYTGLHCYLDQVDETLLRRRGRMPGSIYSGDGAPPMENGVSSLWYNPDTWVKAGSRNRERKDDRRDINHFIHSIHKGGPGDFYRFFRSTCDYGKFYSYWAIDTIFGSPHHDDNHNHKLYVDPFTGLFEPVEWDVRMWVHFEHKEWVTPPLLKKVILNPVLESERDQVCYDLIQSRFTAKKIDGSVDQIERLITPELAADRLRDNAVMPEFISRRQWVSVPFLMISYLKKIQLLKSRFAERLKFLEERFKDSRLTYSVHRIDDDHFNLRISVSGNSGVEISSISDGVSGKPLPVVLDLGLDAGISEQDPLVFAGPQFPGSGIRIYPGRKIVRNTSVHAQTYPGLFQIIPHPLSYSFICKSSTGKIRFNPRNIITGSSVEAVQCSEVALGEAQDSVHPWSLYSLLNIPQKTVTLSGNIDIRNDTFYDSRTKVIVQEGTVFSLSEGCSIYFSGGIEALGTAVRPIIFRATGRPWGSLIVRGRESAGSVLEHCRISNGSHAEDTLAEYPGMVNFHAVENFRISGCIFDSSSGDDALHVAYGKGLVKHCEFKNSAMDAFDGDMADVRIEGCGITESGNDGIDFMHSVFTVESTSIANSRDKGISVGEKSHGNLSGTLIENCRTGIASKDDSLVRMTGTTIRNCLKNTFSYVKNPAYSRKGKIISEENREL